MTPFEEAKDQVAKEHGYDSWSDMFAALIYIDWDTDLFKRIDEAAELYARSMAAQSLKEIEKLKLQGKEN